MTPEPPATPAEAPSGPTTALTVHPMTGEVLYLAGASSDQLADWRLELIEAKHALDALASDLDVELVRRLDFEGVRSAQVGGYEIKVDAPTIVEYDVPRLTIALEALVTDGRISRGVAERAIKVEVTRSARQVELNRLLAHADPEVRTSVARTRSEVERTRRRATVRRAR